jgi:hypothetical protein
VRDNVDAGAMIDFLFLRRFPTEPPPSAIRKFAAERAEQQRRLEAAKRASKVNIGMGSVARATPRVPPLSPEPALSRAEVEQRQKRQEAQAHLAREAAEYRAVLAAMSHAQVSAAYRDEKARLDAESEEALAKEAQRKNGPAAALAEWARAAREPTVNYKYYRTLAYWSRAECVALLMGKDPTWLNSPLTQSKIETSEIGAEFARITEILRRATTMWDLQERTRPVDLIPWARKLGLTIPSELSDLFPDTSPKPNQPSAREQANRIAELEAEVARLSGLFERANASASVPSKAGETKKLRTAQKLFFGVCQAKYGVSFEKGRPPAVKKIREDLAGLDITVAPDTIEDHLLAGSEEAAK